MSKVEELRADVIACCLAVDPHEAVDALILAARAEGAEQERERIVRGSERFAKDESVVDSEYISIMYGAQQDDTVANVEIFVVPASVLAPAPKEEGK